MNLKPLIQSKASQKDKKVRKRKIGIYMESRKTVLMSLAENRLVDSGGR